MNDWEEVQKLIADLIKYSSKTQRTAESLQALGVQIGGENETAVKN